MAGKINSRDFELPDLTPTIRQTAELLDRVAKTRGGHYLNSEGGDVGVGGNNQSIVRHIANYAAAARLAKRYNTSGPALDVGSGSGALAVWLARNLKLPLYLADHDAKLLELAKTAFPKVKLEKSLVQRRDWAGLVTAMEVIEHITPGQQPQFIATLYSQLRPGGLLILSTPDESLYPGGWSGYGPHIGCLTLRNLSKLLRQATGQEPQLWYLGGAPFYISRRQAWLEAGCNRLWNRLQKRTPSLAAGLSQQAASPQVSYVLRLADYPQTKIRVSCQVEPRCNGLLAVVRKP